MNRQGRALVGYMARDSALQALNDGTMPAPETQQGIENQWSLYRQRVQARSEFEAKSPVTKAPSSKVERQLTEIASRPDVKALFAPHRWEVGVVDLSVPILTYQPVIQTASAVERVAGVDPDDWNALVELCLPALTPIQVEGGFDPAQNAFTLSSLNPNLRVMSFEVVDVPAPGAPIPKKVFGFTVGLGSSHVQVAEYQGRWMIRDGHHRLYGLLKANIRTVPAIVIRAQTWEETGAGRSGFFGHEQLYSGRPPQFADYLSDDFSAEVQIRALRKVVRLRAEEFAVLV